MILVSEGMRRESSQVESVVGCLGWQAQATALDHLGSDIGLAPQQVTVKGGWSFDNR